MVKKRDYSRYELKNGNNVLYVGITDNPERREVEHKEDKNFSHMNIIGPKVTKDSAEEWEEKRLEQYRENHGGKNPKYNETDK